MTEKPIIFSANMVRAILENRKTQTRRVIKPQPECWVDQAGYSMFTGPDEISFRGETRNGTVEYCRKLKYQKDDLLWVRETWIPDPPQDGTWDYYAFTDGELYNFHALPDRFKNQKHIIYRASWDGVDLRWRPSILMPRWASRITLRVTDVRVQRVQEISEEDAIAEGIESWYHDQYFRDYLSDSGWTRDPVDSFQSLWYSINGKKHPWSENPWVWTITFERVK